MPEAPDDRVLMTHPTLPDSAPVDVSRRQLDLVYAPLGWVPADDLAAGSGAESAVAVEAPSDGPTSDGALAAETPPAVAASAPPAAKRGKAATAAPSTPELVAAADVAAPDAPKGS